jgi:hypothetical protein
MQQFSTLQCREFLHVRDLLRGSGALPSLPIPSYILVMAHNRDDEWTMKTGDRKRRFDVVPYIRFLYLSVFGCDCTVRQTRSHDHMINPSWCMLDIVTCISGSKTILCCWKCSRNLHVISDGYFCIVTTQNQGSLYCQSQIQLLLRWHTKTQPQPNK